MVIYCDGFFDDKTRSGGYTVIVGDSHPIVHYIDRDTTVSETELLGILEACKQAPPLSTIISDSKWVIEKIHALKYPNRSTHGLLDPINKCRELLKTKMLALIWQPRKINAAGKNNSGNFKHRRKILKRIRTKSWKSESPQIEKLGADLK